MIVELCAQSFWLWGSQPLVARAARKTKAHWPAILRDPIDSDSLPMGHDGWLFRFNVDGTPAKATRVEYSPFKRHFAFTESHPQNGDGRDYVIHIHLHAQAIPIPERRLRRCRGSGLVSRRFGSWWAYRWRGLVSGLGG